MNIKKELTEEYEKYLTDLKDLIQHLNPDNWSVFRYPFSTDGKKIFASGEILDFHYLKKQYDGVSIFLTHTIASLSPYTDYVDYLKFDDSVRSKSLEYALIRTPDHTKDVLIGHLNKAYVIVKAEKIWFAEEANCYLYLKNAHDEYFVIAMKE